MDQIKNAKMEHKINSQILAECEKKTLLRERIAKYYNAQVLALEEDSGRSEITTEATSSRTALMDMSMRVREAVAFNKIESRRDKKFEDPASLRTAA